MIEPTLGDKYFFELMRRGRYGSGISGLVRSDRALLYISQQLEKLIRNIEERKTKGLGETYYLLNRFAREAAGLGSFSGDAYLGEQIYGTINKFSERTPREDALVSLRELSRTLDQYKPASEVDDVDNLRARIATLEEQLGDSEPDGDAEAELDVGQALSVFVIMPFRPEFNDVWKGGIQKAARAEGFKAIRVDMVNRSTNITDDIVDSINKCRLAIVDVTDNNPNVMFELGYTLAKKKPNIIISQSADYLPFDIRNIRTIIYSNSWSGVEDLRVKVQDFLREFLPSKQAAKKQPKKAGKKR